MPTPTYKPIANITMGSAANSVTFSSITGVYKDLVLIFSGSVDVGGSMCIEYNDDSTTNYTSTDMYGNGSASGSGTGAYVASVLFGRSYSINSGQVFSATANIFDYSSTDKYKSALTRGNAAGQLVEAAASKWASTASITKIRVFNNFGNISAGSTFALYGVLA